MVTVCTFQKYAGCPICDEVTGGITCIDSRVGISPDDCSARIGQIASRLIRANPYDP
ncbi:MAG: hypothetical protein JWO20_2048 [Candidatus Angelobacter sp.]|nr:hypothetical protein [Candidatus Angelobacter sp.]